MLGVVSLLRTIQENKYGMFRVVQWRDRNIHVCIEQKNRFWGFAVHELKEPEKSDNEKARDHAMVLIHPSPPPPNPSRQPPYIAFTTVYALTCCTVIHMSDSGPDLRGTENPCTAC